MHRTYVWCYVLLFALVIVGYPIVAAITSYLDLESRISTIPYRAVVVGFGLVVVYFATVYRWGRWYGGLGVIFALVFLAFYVNRLLWDTFIDPVPLRLPPEEYWLQFFGVCFLPAIPFLIAPDKEIAIRGYQAVLYSAIAAGIAHVVLVIKDFDSRFRLEQFYGRLDSEIFGAISLGHLGVTLILLAVAPIFLKGFRGLLWMPTSLLASAIGAAIVALSASRGPILALVICLFFLSVAHRKEHKGTALAVFGVLLLATFLAALWAEHSIGSITLQRLELLSSDEDVSFLERREAASAAWAQFLDSPLFGSGIEERIFMFYPHNTFVEGFMSAGIIGGLAYAALLLLTAWKAYRTLRTDAAWIGFIYIQQLVFGQTSGALYTASVLWATMASVLALTFMSDQQNRRGVSAKLGKIRWGSSESKRQLQN